jgi:hypothetical protein
VSLSNPANAASDLLLRRDHAAHAYQAEQSVGLRSRLGTFVRDAFTRAKRHKEAVVWRNGASVHETMMRCLRMRHNEYDPELSRALDGIDVYMPLASMKMRAAQAWIRDTLANAEDKPWTVEPTPIPELSDAGKLAARQAFLLEVQRSGVELQYLAPYQVQARIKQLEDVAADIVLETAREACARMEKHIADQLEEGGWREAFDAAIEDLTVFPAAVLKSPIVRRVQAPQWDGERLRIVARTKVRVERVSPFDLYPAPDATHPQDGSYLCERMPMTGKALSDCIGLPNFSERAIRTALTLHPGGYACSDPVANERAQLEGLATAGAWGASNASSTGHDGTYDVVDFWGRVPGAVLLEWCQLEGLPPSAVFGERAVDPDAYYEANVWLLGDLVLRSLLNPIPTGQRPYQVASFSRLPGSFWGEGLGQILRDVQRQVNSAARRLVQNMAYASGPIAEINLDLLDESEDTPNLVRPYRVFYTQGAGKGRAINMEKIPSVAAELNAVLQAYWRLADEVSGVPAYAYGGTTPATGAAATMGGLSLLYNSALRGIKQAIGNLDKHLIEPTIAAYYLLNMLLNPDASLKADATVVARGAKGIMAREMRQARTVETLQAITPFAQGGLLPREGLVNLLRDWVGLQGFNPDLIFGKALPMNAPGTPPLDPANAGEGTGARTTPATAPATAMPALDGRQGSVVDALRGDAL